MITSAKNYTKKNPKKADRQNLGQMVKVNLYRQTHTKKITHTPSQKEKKEYIYIYTYIYIYVCIYIYIYIYI